MGAGRVAADREVTGVVEGLLARVSKQPQRCGLAVIRGRRIGVLGREPVLDADNRQACLPSEPFQAEVLHVAAAEGPATAVNMEEGAPRRRVRPDDPQRNRRGAPVDLDRAGFVEEHRSGIDEAALAPCAPALLWRERVNDGIVASRRSSSALKARVSASSAAGSYELISARSSHSWAITATFSAAQMRHRREQPSYGARTQLVATPAFREHPSIASAARRKAK